VLIEDDVLPAAAHLAGPHARAVLAPVVEAAGGDLRSARPCHVQYRPGQDVVVRFTASVSWNGAAPVPETLLAGTSVAGPPPGAVPMVAHDGERELTVGVWRWPFDPVLRALPDVVTPGRIDRLLRGHLTRPLRVEVLAYRPTERVVARVTDAVGRCVYVKVVEPRRTAALVERHDRLRAGGVPVPEVVASDPLQGWFAMAPLHGPTMRERIKADAAPWPSAASLLELTGAVAGVALPRAAPVRRRLDDAILHGAMLTTVMPDQRPRIERLTAALGEAVATDDVSFQTIHGDLHEAQIVVDGARVTGVLDVDDAGPGDGLDDLATMLAHLRFRAASADNGPAIDAYVLALERDLHRVVDARALAARTAAVLVGLATGPFRIQQRGWRHDVRRHLATAEQVVATALAAGG
jgi:aminoglycoside phosphotransferase